MLSDISWDLMMHQGRKVKLCGHVGLWCVYGEHCGVLGLEVLFEVYKSRVEICMGAAEGAWVWGTCVWLCGCCVDCGNCGGAV